MLVTGNVLVAVGLALLVGGMLFFGAVLTPLVFANLAPDVAGPFLRAVFPRFYAYVAVCAVLAGAGFLARGQLVCVVVMALILAATLWAWLWLIPYLNAMRDAGNMVAFDRGHKVSTWLYGVELIAAVWLLVRTAI